MLCMKSFSSVQVFKQFWSSVRGNFRYQKTNLEVISNFEQSTQGFHGLSSACAGRRGTVSQTLARSFCHGPSHLSHRGALWAEGSLGPGIRFSSEPWPWGEGCGLATRAHAGLERLSRVVIPSSEFSLWEGLTACTTVHHAQPLSSQFMVGPSAGSAPHILLVLARR